MLPSEGRRVQFIGESDGLVLGEVGKLLSAGPTHSHIRWNSGQRKGSITLTANDDLVPFRSGEGTWEEIDDDLGTGDLVTVSARQVVDEGGIPALLNTMVIEGHLSTFGPAVDEAVGVIAARLRADPSMLEVLAELEEDEGEALIYRATQTLLRSAFSD